MCLSIGGVEGCHPHVEPSDPGTDQILCPDKTIERTAGENIDETTGKAADEITGEITGEMVGIDLIIRESPVDTECYDIETDRIYKEAFLKALTDQAPIRYRDKEGIVTYRELLPDGEGMGDEEFQRAIRQSDFFYQDYDGDGLPELIIDTEGPCVLRYHPEEEQVELYQQKEQGWHLLGAGQMYMDDLVCTEEHIGSVRGYESMTEEGLSACYLLSPIGEEGTVCRVTIDGQGYVIADEETKSRLLQDFYSLKKDAPHPMSFAVLFGEGGGAGYLPGNDQPPRYLLEDMEALPMNEAGGEEWETYKAMMEGDFSIVEDKRWTSLQRDYESSIVSGNGRCGWDHLLMDLDQDGVSELVIRLDPDMDRSDSIACFYYEDGHVKMWGRSYGADDPDWYERPLSNGRILTVSWYRDKCEVQKWIDRLDGQGRRMTERGYYTGKVTYDQDDEDQGTFDGQTEERTYHEYRDYYHDGSFCGGVIDLSEEEWEQIEDMIESLSIPEEAWKPCSVFTPREERPDVPQEERTFISDTGL